LAITEETLSEIYRYGRELGAGDSVRGTNLVAQSLALNFDVFADHYVTIELSVLEDLIDDVGGVIVDIGVEYDATAYGLPHFQPGPMHMDGRLALSYATAADIESIWSGLERQTEVLQALRDRILSIDVLPRIPELFNKYRTVVTTDLSLEQILQLSCIVKEIAIDQIAFAGLGPNTVDAGPAGALLPDVEAIRLIIEVVFSR
jgi:anionic cell wall polymer biosynthesis LytR-Cps2A-Psr (LCP) family protein